MKKIERFELALERAAEKRELEWYELVESEYYKSSVAEELGVTVEELVTMDGFKEFDRLSSDEL